MAIWNYEMIEEVIIENAKTEKGFLGGVHKVYRITPNEGYVLHDSTLDYTDTDFETGEEKLIHGFSATAKTCGASYDFTLNPREFYTAEKQSVVVQ